MLKFHQKVYTVKDILVKRSYSENFIDKCVKIFLNKLYIPRRIIQTAGKQQLTIVLLFMGIMSTELNVKLHETFQQLLLWTESDIQNFLRHEKLFELRRQI